MSRNSVLIIHRYFWPENISETPYLLKTIAEMHVARGDQVAIATGSSSDFTARWDEAFGDNVSIERFIAANDRGLPIARKIVALVKLMLLAAQQILKAKPDVIYTISYPPGFSAFVILFAKIFSRKSRTIYYVQDLLTYRISNPIVRKLYRAVSRWTLRNADQTITLSPAMKRQLSEYDSSGKANIAVIANCFAFDGNTGELGPPRRDVIYAGAHGKSQNLMHFLKAVAQMAAENRPSVDFFGDGDEKAALRRAAEELGIADSVRFNDPVPREQIIAEIAASRFGLVGAVPGLMNYAFPSKIANYTCAGIPALIMCETGGELAEWLAENRLGVAIDPVDEAKAAETMASAMRDARAEQGARGKDLSLSANRFFGVEGYQKQLEAVLDDMQSARPEAR